MRSAAQAYGAVAKQVASPRDREADLLLKAASRLQAVKDGWDKTKPELDAALLYNRKLWTIFLASVTSSDHPLPAEIRQNVASLGLFVVHRTTEMLAKPHPEQLTPLIGINRELAAGLRGSA
jgi:flagellar biosynthesis activator protein FlaF